MMQLSSKNDDSLRIKILKIDKFGGFCLLLYCVID